MRQAVLGVFLLGGCATSGTAVGDLDPVATYSSPKSATALEGCLADNLGHLGGPSVIRGETHTTLNFGSGGIVSQRISLTPKESGTEIAVRSGYPYFRNVRNRVEGCL